MGQRGGVHGRYVPSPSQAGLLSAGWERPQGRGWVGSGFSVGASEAHGGTCWEHMRQVTLEFLRQPCPAPGSEQEEGDISG